MMADLLIHNESLDAKVITEPENGGLFAQAMGDLTLNTASNQIKLNDCSQCLPAAEISDTGFEFAPEDTSSNQAKRNDFQNNIAQNTDTGFLTQ
jgi:hypothetical protein